MNPTVPPFSSSGADTKDMTASSSPLDAPPAQGLTRAFQLPDEIVEDDELLGLYNEIVDRLRRESAGLSMNTVQQLLLERIANFYVQIKFKEANGSSIREVKDFNAFWLTMTQEFNRLLIASQAQLLDAQRSEINKIITSAVELIEDAENRRLVRRSLAEGFASAKL